jgi:NTP pyrophosphatase (non-canonical NTP hydrolase)
MQSKILTNYTKQVRDGLVVGPNVQVIPHAILGLTEEAGEVAGVFKKSQYLGNKLDFDRLTEELGDVLWYLTFLADWLGVSLEDLAKLNIKKLAQRRPELYTEIGDE